MQCMTEYRDLDHAACLALEDQNYDPSYPEIACHVPRSQKSYN